MYDDFSRHRWAQSHCTYIAISDLYRLCLTSWCVFMAVFTLMLFCPSAGTCILLSIKFLATMFNIFRKLVQVYSGKISVYLGIHFSQLLISSAISIVLHLRLYEANSYRRRYCKEVTGMTDALTWINGRIPDKRVALGYILRVFLHYNWTSWYIYSYS